MIQKLKTLIEKESLKLENNLKLKFQKLSFITFGRNRVIRVGGIFKTIKENRYRTIL